MSSLLGRVNFYIQLSFTKVVHCKVQVAACLLMSALLREERHVLVTLGRVNFYIQLKFHTK